MNFSDTDFKKLFYLDVTLDFFLLMGLLVKIQHETSRNISRLKDVFQKSVSYGNVHKTKWLDTSETYDKSLDC